MPFIIASGLATPKNILPKEIILKEASRGKDSKQLCDIWLEGSRERQGHLEQILKWKTYKTPRNKNDLDPISTYMINQSEKLNANVTYGNIF